MIPYSEMRNLPYTDHFTVESIGSPEAFAERQTNDMKMLIHEQIYPGVIRHLHLCEPYIFADHEKEGRSGHLGHGMAEFAPGKIIDFYPNTSGNRCCGHSAFGWVEYRISEDYGKTFGEARKLPYSWETMLDGVETISVEKVVAGSDGSITAFCLRNSQSAPICCEPWNTPYFVRSLDGGESWQKPREFCPYKGRIYDALTHDGVIYVLIFCNDAVKNFVGSEPDHLYRLYKSTDNGETFSEVCVVPFPETLGRAYGNMIVTPEGELLVYAYNVNDQKYMDVMRSRNFGSTWEACEKSFCAKKIRNPQVGILDRQFILHGRAGENEAGSGALVIYTSADGVHWDEGRILVDGRPACFYSNNLTLRCPDGKSRMLVQYSENYNDPKPGVWSGQVNDMHMWVENAE